MSHYKLKGTSGSVINKSFPIGESIVLGISIVGVWFHVGVKRWLLRSRRLCKSQSRTSARLLDDKALQLKDLGSESGTLLNGVPVNETLLGSGDEIRIGTCRWMLQAPGLRPERVLTDEVVSQVPRRWPRILLWTGLASAAAVVAVAKFKPEWLEYLRSLIQ